MEDRPDEVHNPATGEVVTFVLETAEKLVMRATWPPAEHPRTARHRHPGIEERWTVLDGTPSFEIDGVTVEATPGTTVVAPAGRPHAASNPSKSTVTVRIEMRPPLRWREFVTRFFTGDDSIALLAEYSDEIELA